MNLLDLPNVILYDILEYLTYDEIAKKRIVSCRFNEICQQVLNSGFNKVTRQHSDLFKRIKAMLPRRESERRLHFLARHAEILNSLETRISMLSMTYSKYIDRNLCCFIPGRVLDEIQRITRLIATTKEQLRPHEILQELRDISSMAIEHFDENIAEQFNAVILGRSCPQTNGNSSSGNNNGHGSSTDNQRLTTALNSSSLADISFSGMNTSYLDDHSYSCLNRSPPAASYNYQQQYNVSSYYDSQTSSEDIMRQRINHLLYLPPGELLRHLNAIPYAELNNNYYDYYYANSRKATMEDLNSVSLYWSSTQLKVANTIGSLNSLVRQLQKELIAKSGQIQKLEKRMAAIDELNSNVNQISKNVQQISNNVEQKIDEISTNVEQKFGEISTNVEQINTNVEQKFGEISTNVEQKFGEINTNVEQINTNVEQINTNVEQINTNVEQKFGEISTNVEQKFGEINTNVEQINTNVEQKFGEISTNVEQKFGEINTNVEQKFGEINTNVEQKFGEISTNVEQINTNVEQINTTVEQKIHEINTNVEQKIEEITSEINNQVKSELTTNMNQVTVTLDQVSASVDEVRNEMNTNIYHIREEIRCQHEQQQQQTQYCSHPECQITTPNGTCCPYATNYPNVNNAVHTQSNSPRTTTITTSTLTTTITAELVADKNPNKASVSLAIKRPLQNDADEEVQQKLIDGTMTTTSKRPKL